MKTLRFITVGFVLALSFAVTAFAQTTGSGKMAMIDSRYFDNGKDGILKYSAAIDSLEKEFAADDAALKTLGTKLQTMEKEIRDLQEQISKPNSPIKPEAIEAKISEYDKLGREFKFKQEDGKARFERRQDAVLTPIRQDIGKALKEYASKQGFTLILDIGKIADTGVILALDKAKVDMTQDFIKFYNARPAGAAAAVK